MQAGTIKFHETKGINRGAGAPVQYFAGLLIVEHCRAPNLMKIEFESKYKQTLMVCPTYGLMRVDLEGI